MRALIQRVDRASVLVSNKIVGNISMGLLVFLAIHKDDTEDKIGKMLEKITKLRIFSDENEKMNLSLVDVCGELLLVSQFTLYGDARKGSRPNFILSASAEKAKDYYQKFINIAKQKNIKIQTGKFGAMMSVKLVNNGPVTIILDL